MEASSSSSNAAGGGANIGHLGQTSDIATAFLTALDTSLSKKWREEDRMWRQQDINYRKEEREYRILEQLYREQQVNWRKSDVKQRTLENARCVWNRYVEKNRRDVEEKSEQLKSISNLSALIAGFAVVSLVELNFTNDFEKMPSHVSEWLISVVRGVDDARRRVDVELDGVVHVYSEFDFKERKIVRLRGRGGGVLVSMSKVCEPF